MEVRRYPTVYWVYPAPKVRQGNYLSTKKQTHALDISAPQPFIAENFQIDYYIIPIMNTVNIESNFLQANLPYRLNPALGGGPSSRHAGTVSVMLSTSVCTN